MMVRVVFHGSVKTTADVYLSNIFVVSPTCSKIRHCNEIYDS
jgi:hypothetical protein